MAEQKRPYGKWTKEELLGAESTARQFLQDNSSAIADTMRAKAKYLEALVQRVGQPKTTFDDRLEYFARISEIAALIQQDADGFFQLASQPVVARILKSVRPRV
jgi:predicted dienelactone hydrolase